MPVQVRKRLADASRTMLDLVLPPRCAVCGVVVAEPYSFCAGCWPDIRFLGEPCCARCGLPFAHDMGEGALCGGCHADPPPFARARAATAYGEAARAVALKLKYGRRTSMARLMARHMARHVEAERDALLVPVPLHRWRLWQRGFNQAALIADALARLTGGRVLSDALVRTRRTPPLRAMGRSERRRAVKGAFAVNPARADQVRGRSVILVDDVWTSGATAEGCAAALVAAGAARVELLCWARVLDLPA